MFLDDILVYSTSQEDHEEHLRLVLQCLRDNQLYANAAKCEFFQSEIQYLGHIILGDGYLYRPCEDQGNSRLAYTHYCVRDSYFHGSSRLLSKVRPKLLQDSTSYHLPSEKRKEVYMDGEM